MEKKISLWLSQLFPSDFHRPGQLPLRHYGFCTTPFEIVSLYKWLIGSIVPIEA